MLPNCDCGAVDDWPGPWDTKRVQHLYVARYGRGLYRADARQYLSVRAHRGLLVLDDQPNHRIYILNTRKDGIR